MKEKKQLTQRLTRLAALCALSIILVLIIHFPIFPQAKFLEYDPADVPVLVASFLYGPWWGLMVTVVASIIQGLTVSAASGFIGIIMHILATGAFSVTAGLIYRKMHTMKGAVAALVCGSVAMTTVMVGCNLVFTPLFMGQSFKAVVGMLVPIIIPFNLAKAGLNSVITFILYKPISRLFEVNRSAKEEF